MMGIVFILSGGLHKLEKFWQVKEIIKLRMYEIIPYPINNYKIIDLTEIMV